jgi:hypothetical protein
MRLLGVVVGVMMDDGRNQGKRSNLVKSLECVGRIG